MPTINICIYLNEKDHKVYINNKITLNRKSRELFKKELEALK